MEKLTDRFEKVTTLKELYQFRDELISEELKLPDPHHPEIDAEKLAIVQNHNFFIGRVKNRIIELGGGLDSIKIPDPIAPLLSKREYFAAMALQGILANPEFLKNFSDTDVHIAAVKNADYLIEQLNK